MNDDHDRAPEQHAYRLPYHWCMTPFHRYVVEQAVTRVAAFIEDRTVLEMGCGDGFVTELLARHARRVHAFDINRRAITFARLIVENPNVTFEVASAADIDTMAQTAGGTVDVVAAFEVIEHLTAEELDDFLTHAHGLLALSRGRLVVTTPNGARGVSDRNPHHAHEFTPVELAERVGRAGFGDVRLFGLYLQPPWVRLEHIANTIPFRPVFRALARAGSSKPSLCRTLICVATA